MKNFKTFKRRKSDRIDALRLHQMAGDFRTTLNPLIDQFLQKSDEYLVNCSQTSETDAEEYIGQLNILRDSQANIRSTIDSELDAWFDWKEGERPSLDALEEEKRLSTEAEWSLMEDHALEKSLAIERFSGRVVRGTQHHWDLFFKRASVLTADSNLKVHNCPFNPTKLGNIVFDSIDETELNFKTKSIAFRMFDDTASWAFSDFVKQKNEWLQQEGILPNLQPEQAHSFRPERVDASVVHNITQAMGGSGDVVAIDPAVLQNLINSVSSLQNLANDIPDASDLDAVKAWTNQQASTVSQQFKGSDKSDTIALVSMLFEYFFEDGQLAPQMKHLLAKMQIPIIKVAILDKAFFENSQHAARLLVNRMARAATRWQPSDDLSADTLLIGMDAIVTRLLNEFDEDISLFNELLDDFDALKQQYEHEREHQLLLTRQAEEQALADIESQDRAQLYIAQVLDEVEVPESIATMLKKDWYRLMRLILLKQGESKNWRNSARIAKELVWSLQPFVAAKQGERFNGIVPKMLNGLEDGLRAISKSDESIQQLLVDIAKAHDIVARKEPPSTSDIQFDVELARLDAQMRDADQLIDGPIPLPVVEPEVQHVPADINFYLAIIETLDEQHWFDYHKDDVTERVCLSMIVNEGAKYVFTDNTGKKVLERSAIGLAIALRDSLLEPLDEDELVERTLKSVAEKVGDAYDN